MKEYFLAYGATQALRDYWLTVQEKLRQQNIPLSRVPDPHSIIVPPRPLYAAQMLRARIKLLRLERERVLHPLYVEVGPVASFPVPLTEHEAVLYVPFRGKGVQEEYERIVKQLGLGASGSGRKAPPHLVLAKIPVQCLSRAVETALCVPAPDYQRLHTFVWYRRDTDQSWETAASIELDTSMLVQV